MAGRVALIVGNCDEGITCSIALTLALQGARVVFGYSSRGGGEDAGECAGSLIDAIREAGGEAIAARADLSRAEEVTALVTAAVSAFGTVEVLICRVGASWDASAAARLPIDELDAAVQAEIAGALLCIQACLPYLKRNNWGRIVAIGPFESVCWTHGRSASSARRFLAQQFEQFERPHNISTNLIIPGLDSAGADSHDAALAAARHEAAWQARRQATAQDIADIVQFLCSEPARLIAGSQFHVALE